MLDDGGALTDSPQRSTANKPREELRLDVSEAEEFLRVGDLVGCLLEEDSGASVA